MHDVGVVTVDVVMMIVVSFRTVGVGMIVEFFSMTVLVMHVIVMRMGIVSMEKSRQTVPAMRMIS